MTSSGMKVYFLRENIFAFAEQKPQLQPEQKRLLPLMSTNATKAIIVTIDIISVIALVIIIIINSIICIIEWLLFSLLSFLLKQQSK